MQPILSTTVVAPSTANGDVAHAPRRGPETPSPIAHLTPAERVARGKAARRQAPLAGHAVTADDGQRRDPVEILIQSSCARFFSPFHSVAATSQLTMVRLAEAACPFATVEVDDES